MRKRFCILLVALMLLAMFSGCAAKDPEPLRVCLDFAYMFDFEGNPLWMEDLKILEKSLELKGGPEDIVFEILPEEGSEREVALERIRTEVMSGEGPDVFILCCDKKESYHTAEALFPMPEKAFNLAWFLPLDEYMEENTQFSAWDEMSSVVLEAGRGKEGQQIIPLTYAIPVSVFRQEDVTHIQSKEITWQDLAESEDPTLAISALWTDFGNDRPNDPFNHVSGMMFEYTLGAIADYESEELLFTTEELQQRLNKIYELSENYNAGLYDAVPPHYKQFLGRDFDEGGRSTDSFGNKIDFNNGIKANDPLTFIPLYSDDGGVTAEVTSFAAINRNTRCPEDAFFVLDYISSRDAQTSEGLYYYLYRGTGNSLPMYNDLGSKENFLYKKVSAYPSPSNAYRWYVNDETFQSLCAVREQITYVGFRDVLDKELERMYTECIFARDDPEKQAKIIEACYEKMQRMLRE